MAVSEITVEIKLRWWFLYFYWPCLKGVLWLSRLVNEDVEPDWGKLDYWLRKAVVVKT